MRFLSRVVWSEGMHLGPHHFQTQSRYFEDILSFTGGNLWKYPWGFLSLSLDQDAIRNGIAVLHHASGIFADGLPFDIGDCDAPPPPVNLLECFSPTDTELFLHLALPLRRDTGMNCSLDEKDDGLRYSMTQRSLRDETTGIDEYDVPLGRKNLRLVTTTQPQPGFTSLPVARVLRDGKGGLMYDPDFLPVCLRIHASEALMVLLKRLIETLQDKSASLSKTKRHQTAFEAGTSAMDVSNYWFLHTLHSAIPTLRHLYSTKRGHPEELYRQLARLAGSLSTFALDSNPVGAPEYSHESPGETFRALDQYIRRHLEIFFPSNNVVLDFRQTAPYIYEADVLDERCLRRCRWIFGVRSSMGEAMLLRQTPRLVKICSAAFIPKLVERSLPGLQLLSLPVPPSALRAQADMHYFSLNIADTEPCWKHILQTRRVGVYIPGEIEKAVFEITVIVETS